MNEIDYVRGSGSGVITGVIVFDDRGDEVKIDSNNFFGIRLKS